MSRRQVRNYIAAISLLHRDEFPTLDRHFVPQWRGCAQRARRPDNNLMVHFRFYGDAQIVSLVTLLQNDWNSSFARTRAPVPGFAIVQSRDGEVVIPCGFVRTNQIGSCGQSSKRKLSEGVCLL